MARAVAALVLLVSFAVLLTMRSDPMPSVPPCPTEDSVSCYWHAPTMGNGVGQSYINDAHGNPTYIP